MSKFYTKYYKKWVIHNILYRGLVINNFINNMWKTYFLNSSY